MRNSNDIYKLSNGKLISINQMTKSPKDSKLYTGYDYDLQEWRFEGKKDIRTLKELKQKHNSILPLLKDNIVM